MGINRYLPGDALLLQYAPGDYGVVERTRFERVYRLIADEKH